MKSEKQILLKQAMLEIADKIYNSVVEEKYILTVNLIEKLKLKLKEESEQ